MCVTGSDAWNFQKTDVGGPESGGPKACPKCGRVYPTSSGAATSAGAVLAQKGAFRAPRTSTLCLSARRAYLDGHDRSFPVPEHLCGPAGELFPPPPSDPPPLPPPHQTEPPAPTPARPPPG